jgi:hypothetical protein
MGPRKFRRDYECRTVIVGAVERCGDADDGSVFDAEEGHNNLREDRFIQSRRLLKEYARLGRCEYEE